VKCVLIVHPNIDMLVAIQESLMGFERQLSFRIAKSRAVAEQAGRKGIDLVVTAMEIPADEWSRVGAGEQRKVGIQFVRSLRENNPELPAIIVTDHVDDELSDFTQSANTCLARQGENFERDLHSAVKRLLGSDEPQAPQTVVLSISLSNNNVCTYHFQSNGNSLVTGQLDIHRERLAELVEQSREVHVHETTWEGEFKRIGHTLAEQLFERTTANLEFRDEFNQWVGRVGIENIRVRFTVEDLLHPIAVEALRQRSDKEYWMLRTAIFRAHQPPGGDPGTARPWLFQDEPTRNGRINFLVIAANVPANATVKEGPLDLMLEPLPKLDNEVNAIEALLSKLKSSGRPIGEIRIIRPADVPVGQSFKDFVRQTLRNKDSKWHVVHYAGHTHYDTMNQLGYLFFPGAEIRPVEPVKVAEFALWLGSGDTRFVFLSSCKSAGQDFVYQLIKERVPAIMGFLWKVDDAKAGEYAQSFYECLLDSERKSLEYACLQAKKQMHSKYRDNPIWASPVLVMQVGA
jgi:CheY-like chemotaxis protein